MTNDELGLWLNQIMADHKDRMGVADKLRQADNVLKSSDDHIIDLLSRMIAGHDERRGEAVRLLHELHARVVGGQRHRDEQIEAPYHNPRFLQNVNETFDDLYQQQPQNGISH